MAMPKPAFRNKERLLRYQEELKNRKEEELWHRGNPGISVENS